MLEHLTHLSTFPKNKRYGKLRIWLTAELSSEFITFNIVNDPVKMYEQGVLEEDVANPVSRMRLYSQVGFRFMDFHWTQPSLGEGKEVIDYLYLIMMPFTKDWQGLVEPSKFKYAFLTYLATWKGVDLKKNETVLRMRQELDTRASANRPIKLMNYFDLKIPVEIIKACEAIDWKVKEVLKN